MSWWALLDDLIPVALVAAAFFAGKALGRADAQVDLLLGSLPAPEPAADLAGEHPVSTSAVEAAPAGPDDVLAGAATEGGRR